MPQRNYLSMYARERIRQLFLQGATIPQVMEVLSNEGIEACRQTVWRLKRHIHVHGAVTPLSRSGRPTILTNEVLETIEFLMQRDDETTAKELVILLSGMGVTISRSCVLKGRQQLGWTSRGAAYCQLIREPNKEKRVQWARECLGDGFENVIWSDETTVQLETHRRFCCRKRGQKPKSKPHPKHPVKVHVWGGISWRGATKVCIFEGIMDTTFYINILDQFLVPFIHETYPHGHRFMQDNDPKHVSRRSREFFQEKAINWWPTPPESPDANPIENLWHELKVCK